MVNNKNVSLYGGEPPATGADRKIAGGPLYPREQVLELLAGGNGNLKLWTRKCNRDLQQLALDLSDIAELLQLAMGGGQYRGSEWCQQGTDGPWAACDAYRVVQREWVENAHKSMNVEYFLKFAISATGRLLLVVSAHLC